MVYECRGACQGELGVKQRLRKGTGLAFCKECRAKLRVEGRPRQCPCCGHHLRYRVREFRRK